MKEPLAHYRRNKSKEKQREELTQIKETWEINLSMADTYDEVNKVVLTKQAPISDFVVWV